MYFTYVASVHSTSQVLKNPLICSVVRKWSNEYWDALFIRRSITFKKVAICIRELLSYVSGKLWATIRWVQHQCIVTQVWSIYTHFDQFIQHLYHNLYYLFGNNWVVANRKISGHFANCCTKKDKFLQIDVRTLTSCSHCRNHWVRHNSHLRLSSFSVFRSYFPHRLHLHALAYIFPIAIKRRIGGA